MHERYVSLPANYTSLSDHTNQFSTVAIRLKIWRNQERLMLCELFIFHSIPSEPPFDRKPVATQVTQLPRVIRVLLFQYICQLCVIG